MRSWWKTTISVTVLDNASCIAIKILSFNKHLPFFWNNTGMYLAGDFTSIVQIKWNGLQLLIPKGWFVEYDLKRFVTRKINTKCLLCLMEDKKSFNRQWFYELNSEYLWPLLRKIKKNGNWLSLVSKKKKEQNVIQCSFILGNFAGKEQEW